MKRDLMVDAVGKLDNDLLEKHFKEKDELKTKKAKQRKPVWLKWSAAIAACFAVVVAAAIVIPLLNGGNGHIVGGMNRPYKNVTISGGEYGIVFPWEYMTVYEKYPSVKIDGVEFHGRGRDVDESYINTKIGTYKFTSQEGLFGHSENFNVYSIKNVSSDRTVAVLMDKKYYVYHLEDNVPPSTWGEILDMYGLLEAIEFYRFSKNGKDNANYKLNDDEYIWEVLNSCGSAQYVDPEGWNRNDRNYISLTVTSEKLGIYKKVLYVTEDGYLWTNMFEYAYLYNIGKEVTNKIISYAEKNSQSADFEPYNNSVTGKIVEITDEYLLIDDSILCKNPEDGITFKILLNDIRITRYVDMELIKIGDTVQIEFEGVIDTENGYVIDNALSIFEAIISGSNVLIPE